MSFTLAQQILEVSELLLETYHFSSIPGGTRLIQKQKREQRTLVSVAPRLVPSPRYFAKPTAQPVSWLLQGGIAAGAAGSGAVRGEFDYARLVRAESALAGLSHGDGNAGGDIVSDGRARAAPQSKGVAALDSRGQHVVDQPGRGRGRGGGAGGRRHIAQGACEAYIGVGGGIGHLRRIEGADGTHRRSLIGRNPRPQQVRDGNRRDDQNNRHDDQQLDQRKALLFAHVILPFRNFVSLLNVKNFVLLSGLSRT